MDVAGELVTTGDDELVVYCQGWGLEVGRRGGGGGGSGQRRGLSRDGEEEGEGGRGGGSKGHGGGDGEEVRFRFGMGFPNWDRGGMPLDLEELGLGFFLCFSLSSLLVALRMLISALDRATKLCSQSGDPDLDARSPRRDEVERKIFEFGQALDTFE